MLRPLPLLSAFSLSLSLLPTPAIAAPALRAATGSTVTTRCRCTITNSVAPATTPAGAAAADNDGGDDNNTQRWQSQGDEIIPPVSLDSNSRSDGECSALGSSLQRFRATYPDMYEAYVVNGDSGLQWWSFYAAAVLYRPPIVITVEEDADVGQQSSTKSVLLRLSQSTASPASDLYTESSELDTVLSAESSSSSSSQRIVCTPEYSPNTTSQQQQQQQQQQKQQQQEDSPITLYLLQIFVVIGVLGCVIEAVLLAADWFERRGEDAIAAEAALRLAGGERKLRALTGTDSMVVPKDALLHTQDLRKECDVFDEDDDEFNRPVM